MGAARGRFVVFLDSDDALPASALEVMTRAAEEYNAEFVVSKKMVVVSNDAERKGIYQRMSGVSHMTRIENSPLSFIIAKRKIRSSVCNKLFSKKAIDGLRFTEGIFFEDWPFLTVFAAKQQRVVVVDEPCYIYMKSGGSITRSPFSVEKLLSYERGIRKVVEALRDDAVWKLARRRCAIALSMMINKATASRSPVLMALAHAVCERLFRVHGLRRRELSMKAYIRYVWSGFFLRHFIRQGNSTGISRAEALTRRGADVLMLVSEAMQKVGGLWHVDFGTLLGLVRERQFIGHDCDIDVAVYEDVDVTRLFTALIGSCFTFVHGFAYDQHITELTFAFQGVSVDFFWNYRQGNEQCYFAHERFDRNIRYPHGTKQAKKCRRPLVVKTVSTDFYGMRLPIPENAVSLLEREYGAKWRIPDPAWKASDADPFRQIMPGFSHKVRSASALRGFSPGQTIDGGIAQ